MTQTLSQKLLLVQKNIGAVSKSSDNPFFKSKYGDLNEVLRVAKEALHPYGLYLSQGPGLNEHGRYVETSIIDGDSGQQISCRVPFSGNEKNMQEIGAATTYGRRFGIKSLLAMEDIDDDGETAVGRGNNVNRSGAVRGSSKDQTTAVKAAGSPTPVQPESKPGPSRVSEKDTNRSGSTGTSRKTINEKISLTSKVIIDSKRASQEEVVKLLTAFQVKSKEELTDEQAKKLLAQLEEKLK